MKIVILNKSDACGGAAIVSRRLLEALRLIGVEANMLVCEKLTDSPFVVKAAATGIIKRKFLLERLKIFIANGFNNKTLFKIDTASEGLPLWKHPMVNDADAILVNWVNQGMLSLKGFKKLLKSGKPVIWTMHDMWEMTGICHHAGTCPHFKEKCGSCPLLNKPFSIPPLPDLSTKIWQRKAQIYNDSVLTKRLAFVAVSRWLKDKASQSSLLRFQKVDHIPNAFNIPGLTPRPDYRPGKTRILFGAARLDDPIKGLDTLREASRILINEFPDTAPNLEIAFFGAVKNSKALEGFHLPVVNLGVLKGEDKVAEAYRNADILVSASSYETLPGTLVEAQAYGCIPISFNQGGQADIISHLATGFLAHYDNDIMTRARNLARGVIWACSIIRDPKKLHEMQNKMRFNVESKFSFSQIAKQYINLIHELKSID